MKYPVLAVVFAFCLVGTLALTEEQLAKLKEYKNSCIVETGVDPAVVESAKVGNIPSDNPQIACFASCLLQKIGILSADGVFNEEVLRAKVPPEIPKEQIDELLAKCKDVSGANVCEKGGNMLKCFIQNKRFQVIH